MNKSLVTQMLHLLKKAKTYAERVAIQSDGKEFTYGYLDQRSDEIASFLLGEESDLNEERIGLLVRPDIHYVVALWEEVVRVVLAEVDSRAVLLDELLVSPALAEVANV